jgi:transposase
MSQFIRKVKTASGATAVQVVTKTNSKITNIIHIGSAHTEDQLASLFVLARKQLLSPGQLPLPLEEERGATLSAIIQKSAVSAYLWDTLDRLYVQMGFNKLGEEIFKQLVIARLIEPGSKLDSLRIMKLSGVENIPTEDKIYRLLPKLARPEYRNHVADICWNHVKRHGNLSLVLYDVTTLYFEAQKEDDLRKPGLSKERRLEPQIVVGLLVDRNGSPLEIHEFEGNLAETKTIAPILKQFAKKRSVDISGLTVATDAGMLNSNNLAELEHAGLKYIVGSRMSKTPFEIELLGGPYRDLTDGLIIDTTTLFTQNGRKVRRRVIYQYKEKRAKLDLKNIEKQIEKANRIISGKSHLKKAKFLTLSSTAKSLDMNLIEKHKDRAGWKGYVTNLPKDGIRGVPPLEIISNYHQLFQVEKTIRMSKSDLRARPIYHHKADSIRAHLTVILASLSIARYIEDRTDMSLRKFIQTLRPIVTGQISINGKTYPTLPNIPKDVEEMVGLLFGGY